MLKIIEFVDKGGYLAEQKDKIVKKTGMNSWSDQTISGACSLQGGVMKALEARKYEQSSLFGKIIQQIRLKKRGQQTDWLGDL